MKAQASIFSSVLGSFISFRPKQPSNALPPIYVIPGRLILSRESQCKMPVSSILFNDGGRLILFRLLHSAKVRGSIVSTPLGMAMLFKDLQFAYLLLVDYQYYTL